MFEICPDAYYFHTSCSLNHYQEHDHCRSLEGQEGEADTDERDLKKRKKERWNS